MKRPAPARGSRHLGARLATTLFVALALVGVGAAPAFAHAVLEGTDPGAGAQVARSPRVITLRYGEPVEAALGAIRLYNSKGDRIDVGAPESPPGYGNEVASSVPSLDDGSYVVTWRVISADSHPVRGAFTFTVGPGVAQNVEGLTTRLLSQQGGSTSVGSTFALTRAVLFGGLALLVGAAAFLVLVWPEGRMVVAARRLVWGGWLAALLATLAGFALQGAYAGALPFTDALKPSIWVDVWDTRYGHVSALRIALLLLAFPLLRMLLPARGRPPAEHSLPSWWSGAAGVVGAGLVLTPGLAGHAATGMQIPLAILADAVHVGGVALWVGGLSALGFALLPHADLTTLRRAVPRYSQLALYSVVAIVVSGSYQAWRQVGTLSALTSTDYGRILLVKLGLFVVLIVAAAFGRDVVNQKYREYEDDEEYAAAHEAEPELAGVGAVTISGAPGLPGRGPDPDPEDPHDAFEHAELDDETAVRRLRRSVGIEIVITILVLSVTALLVNAAPAREAGSGPWIGYIKTPTLWFDTNIVPAKVGPNDVHLSAITAQGGPKDTLEMTAQFTETERDVGPIDVPLRRLAPGHYFSPGFRLPFSGTWTLTVRALVSETDEVVGTARIPVR